MLVFYFFLSSNGQPHINQLCVACLPGFLDRGGMNIQSPRTVQAVSVKFVESLFCKLNFSPQMHCFLEPSLVYTVYVYVADRVIF